MAEIVPFPPPRRPCVLVVDDEPVIRGVLSEHLDDCGFRALTAGTADEAAAILAGGEAVDLVFTDVRMPGKLDGYGLARWVQANRPEIPVILVSGDIGKANAAVELCGVETFLKPYDFDSAARKIRETIARTRRRTA